MQDQILDQPEGGTSKGQMLDNARRYQVVFWIGIAFIVIKALSLISDIMQYRLLLNVQQGVGFMYDMEDLEANDQRQGLVAIAEFIIYIFFIVYFIMWFRRAYANMDRIGINTGFSEGWAAGAWFVPILNLFRPFQIALEIRRHYEEHDPAQRKVDGMIAIMWLWWLTFIVGNFFSNRTLFGGESINDLLSTTTKFIISGVLHLASLGSLMVYLYYIHRREERFFKKELEQIPLA